MEQVEQDGLILEKVEKDIKSNQSKNSMQVGWVDTGIGQVEWVDTGVGQVGWVET